MIEIGWGWIALVAFVSFISGALGITALAVRVGKRKRREREGQATVRYPEGARDR